MLDLLWRKIWKERQTEQFRINRSGARAIRRFVPKSIAVIRMQVQRHPVDARADARFLEFRDNFRSFRRGVIPKADRVKVPGMDAVWPHLWNEHLLNVPEEFGIELSPLAPA